MSAGALNIRIEKGARFVSVLTIKDSNDAAINLTGYTFAGKIKKGYGTETLATFTFVIATQSGATTGQVTMSLTAAQTAALPIDPPDPTTDYLYDVTYAAAAADPDRLIEGTATVVAGIT